MGNFMKALEAAGFDAAIHFEDDAFPELQKKANAISEHIQFFSMQS